MKYVGVPLGIWVLFVGSFQNHLSSEFGYGRPDVERLTEYYAKAMMTGAMKWYCRQSGKSKFSTKDIENMRTSAKRKAADRNPYSCNFDFYDYPDGSGYKKDYAAIKE